MTNYRSVSFHDLCRVCTAHAQQRVNIFSADGKSKNLCAKIADCLSLMVSDTYMFIYKLAINSNKVECLYFSGERERPPPESRVLLLHRTS